MIDEPARVIAEDYMRDEPKMSIRHVAMWIVAVVVAGAATAGVVAFNERNARVQAKQDATEPTAWENRLAMDQVLVETAKVAGINSQPLPEQEETLSCIRNDGRPGVSYFLHPIKDGPLEDITATLDRVEQFWRDKGYAVTTRPKAGALSAAATDGATLHVIAGPLGIGMRGETGCALVDGAPGA